MLLRIGIKYIFLKVLRFLIFALLLILAGILFPKLDFFFKIIASFCLIIASFKCIQLLMISYKIEDFLLCVKSGIFQRKVSYVELFRVEDIEVGQTIGERIFGYSTVTLYSHDFTDNKLYIVGMENGEKLAKYIRDNILIARRNNQIIGLG